MTLGVPFIILKMLGRLKPLCNLPVSNITRTLPKSILPNIQPKVSHTTTVMKLKKKSQAVQELATDNKGVHPHKMKEIYVKDDCEKKKCTGLCDTLEKVKTEGYFTHKPIADKFTRYISEKDANDKEDSQYYCKNTAKSKEIDGNKALNYMQNKEIIPDAKMIAYINQPEISSKIEE